MSHSRPLKYAAFLGRVIIGTVASASPPSGVTPTNFATANLEAGDHLNSDRIKFQTKDSTDVRMQRLEFAAGGTTGWHHHPGMVMVIVQSGTITLWNTSCGKTDYGPGSPNGAIFIEALPDAHQATSTNGANIAIQHQHCSDPPRRSRISRHHLVKRRPDREAQILLAIGLAEQRIVAGRAVARCRQLGIA